MPRDEELLESIDGKLGAILALILDFYLRETEVAKPKPRSVDRLLADAGLTATQTASLLGKTKRAVNLQLQADRNKGAKAK